MAPQDATRDRHWIVEEFQERLLFGLRRGRTIFDKESEFQRVQIVRTEFGKTLLLENAFMCSELDEHRYHEMLAHVPLTTTKNISRVLIIGGGDGGTLREVLRHPEVEHVTLCELDEMVVRACQEHFQEMHVPWNDRRVTYAFGDGAQFVADAKNEYDIILVDGADPVPPADVLFSPGFYANCRRILSLQGALASQTEAPLLMREDFLKITRTMQESFHAADPYFVPIPIYPSGDWSFGIAIGERHHGNTPQPNLERAKHLSQVTRYYNAAIHEAAFAVPNELSKLIYEVG